MFFVPVDSSDECTNQAVLVSEVSEKKSLNVNPRGNKAKCNFQTLNVWYIYLHLDSFVR